MSSYTSRATPVRRLLVVAGSALMLLLTTLLVQVEPAWSHGSTISPPSRNYGCWQRWGNDFQNPNMATLDPMCWQAWQADPNAMWNWNGLFIDGVGGNHEAAVPSGTLCSGGLTSGGRYAALDTPGNWRATDVGNTFNVRIHDQALHGADYFRLYVTRQGFNPLTERLGWDDLELRRDTGQILPGVGEDESDPVLNGVTIAIDGVTAPGRTGRHILFVVWKASHSDQNYYWCSDVRFPGGPTDPTTPPPTTPPPTTPPPTSPPPTSPPPGGTGACTASFTKAGEWSGGFQGDVRVTAGTTAIRGWTVTMAFPNGQAVSSMWNATPGGTGSTVTATNVGYNGNLGAGQSAQFGFLGTWNGTNNPPTVSCTAS
jgi:predicted carbohydrate-binding protein with CBM5 and CBM33 domain